MKVLKFGSTSLGSAEQIRETASLIDTKDKSIVVVSPMAGTREALAELAGYLYNRNFDGARETISSLEKQYAATANALLSDSKEASGYLDQVFRGTESIARELFTEPQEKAVLAQGEALSSYLLTACLRERGVDACLLPALSFMRTDFRGEPDMDHLRTSLQSLLDASPEATVFVTQGSVCMNVRDEVVLFRTGGADYTACLIGAALQADEIDLYKSRIAEGTRAVAHLHFEEAAELAYFGAEILHPTCIQPARYANVPVRLLSAKEPSAPGTLIDNVLEPGVIKAVAAKDNITAIKIKSSRMLLAHGFLRKVFEIFEGYRTSIDMICTSEVGVSLTIDDTRYLNEIVRDLKKYGTVAVDLDMCIVCVVGDMNWANKGFESRVLDALRDIPVRMVSYGGSNFNISVLVKEEDKAATLSALNSKLFGE